MMCIEHRPRAVKEVSEEEAEERGLFKSGVVCMTFLFLDLWDFVVDVYILALV